MAAFERVIGIVGHPTEPDIAWSEAQLEALKEVGIETLQLSIAWASRPAGEVLNLENLEDAENRAEWRRRIALAKRFGFRTLAHFGLPMGPQFDATTCILDPAVSANYAARLRGLFADFPEIDEVLVYTYDQQAWLCSEFGDCPRCRRIPLHLRLTPFLEGLVDAVQEAKPGARLWWEPWELSAGQTLAIAERIRPANFGLILHHTIAEVQFVNTTDLWFRNLARCAHARGIPVIGEGFFGGSGEDVHPMTHLACPRLVFQQLHALHTTCGVVGAKEYYGLVPAHFGANAEMLRRYLLAPEETLEAHLGAMALAYPAPVRETLLEAWETTAQAMELFPWDASWALRRVFDGTRSGDGNAIPGASWMTPSWQANRRGYYLVTDEQNTHPWLREDVGLRAEMAGRAFGRAAAALRDAHALGGSEEPTLERQAEELENASRVSKAFGENLLRQLHR